MRIQHNIAALNSYRQLSGNNNALSKNLEKLSSGYKINRAGDDAAGLAISEKMRAQIKGLEAAQKNANDGISLVQTAEGALTEVHDMLNRMTYLATQSANGTYDNDVDRANLQKEVSSLLEEIDRISESTNFNGLNLLDGTLGLNTTAFTGIDSKDAVTAGTESSDLGIGNQVVHRDGVAATDAVKAEFTVSLKNLTTTDDAMLKITINGEDFTLTNQVAGNKSVNDIANAFKNEYGSVTIDGVDYTVSVESGEGLKFTQTNTPAKNAPAIHPDFDVEVSAKTVETAATFEIDLTGIYDTLGNVTANDKLEITVGGQKLTSGDLAGTEAKDSDIAALFNGKTITVGSETYTATVNGSKLTLTGSTATGVTDAGDKVTDGTVAIAIDGAGGTTITDPGTFKNANYDDGTSKADDSLVSGEYISHVVSTKSSVSPSDVKLAEATFTLDFDNIKDGTKLTVGDKTYTFAVGKDSDVDTTGGDVIDLTKLEEADITTNQDKVTTAVVGAIKGGNDVWEVGNWDAASGKIGLLEQATHATDIELDTIAKIDATIKMVTDREEAVAESSVTVDGSKMVAGDKIEIDGKVYEFVAKAGDAAEGNEEVVVAGLSNKTGTATESAAQKLAAKIGTNASESNNVVTVKAADMTKAAPTITSAGVKLQVGDTSDEYNKVNVQVGNMDAESLGIADVDISTQEGAAAAITKIKAAINSVSSTRGDLGAIQNRLEHTINNLGVTTENITAAESRIRDTDMAEEMMAYTKNNILVQAAQAMLAQANQVPQGVLQLLQ